MGDVHYVPVISPIVDAEQQVEAISNVSHVIGVDLVVPSSCAVGPFIVQIKDMYPPVPMNQVLTDKEIPVGCNSTYVIITCPADYSAVGDAGNDRIVYVLGKRQRSGRQKGGRNR